jgi:hypothetical protein
VFHYENQKNELQRSFVFLDISNCSLTHDNIYDRIFYMNNNHFDLNNINLENKVEIWDYKNPLRGDHIRVNRGIYNHHGIFVANDEVIHFASINDDNILRTDNKVIKASINDFLRNGKVEVKIYTDDEKLDLYPTDAIVNWARSCLNDQDYNLIFNNCEHFANWCTLARFRSYQVENLFGGNNMGFLGDIWDGVKDFFGLGGSNERSSSTYSYNYEPDKVRVAEIEKEKAIKLAEIDQQSIEIKKEAQIEIIRVNAEMQAAIIQARAKGFEYVSKVLLAISRDLNTIAEQRFQLLELGQFEIAKKIENMYSEFITNIKNDGYRFNIEELPKMLKLLEQYDKTSDSYSIYKSSIEKQKDAHIDFEKEQISKMLERQSKLIDSSITSKNQINEHVSKIVEGRMDYLKLEMNKFSEELSKIDNVTTSKQKQVEDKSKNKIIASDTKEVTKCK